MSCFAKISTKIGSPNFFKLRLVKMCGRNVLLKQNISISTQCTLFKLVHLKLMSAQKKTFIGEIVFCTLCVIGCVHILQFDAMILVRGQLPIQLYHREIIFFKETSKKIII